MGTAMSVERKVTMKDPTISGQIPNAGGSKVGYHSLPRRKSLTETTRKMGSPSRNRKVTIRPRIRIDTQAKRKKMRLMMISLSLLVIVYVVLYPLSFVLGPYPILLERNLPF